MNLNLDVASEVVKKNAKKNVLPVLRTPTKMVSGRY